MVGPRRPQLSCCRRRQREDRGLWDESAGLGRRRLLPLSGDGRVAVEMDGAGVDGEPEVHAEDRRLVCLVTA